MVDSQMRRPQTVEEWFAETDPELLIAALKNRSDDHRLRRLACSFAREAWQWLTDERSRHAVIVAERFALGEATQDELAAAEREAIAVLDNGGFPFVAANLPTREGRVAWYAARCAANAAGTRALTSTTNSAAWFAASLACEALGAAQFEHEGVVYANDPRWSVHRENAARCCALVREEFPESPFPLH